MTAEAVNDYAEMRTKWSTSARVAFQSEKKRTTRIGLLHN